MYCISPVYRTANEWLERNAGEIWLSWSIFNPSGPTISCLGIKDTGSRGEVEFFYRWMHFLDGENYCLGYVKTEEPDAGRDTHEILTNAFSLDASRHPTGFPMVNSVPSVAVVSAPEKWAPIVKEVLLSSQAFQEADWGRERYLLKKYGARLFDRAGEETREALEQMKVEIGDANREFLEFTWRQHEHIDSFLDWEPGGYKSRGLEDGDFDAWWGAVTSPGFLALATAQFAQAWVGGAAQTPQQCRTPLEEVRDFFLAYSHPWWPKDFTTEKIESHLRR